MRWIPGCNRFACRNHYSDVIMSAMVSQINGVSSAYSTVCSGVDQRRHQRSAPLAFVRGLHRRPVNSPHKEPVMRKMFPFDDVIMQKCGETINPLWPNDDMWWQRTGIIQTNDGLLYWRMYASPTSTLKHITFTQLVGQYLRYFVVKYVALTNNTWAAKFF